MWGCFENLALAHTPDSIRLRRGKLRQNISKGVSPRTAPPPSRPLTRYTPFMSVPCLPLNSKTENHTTVKLKARL